MTKISEKMTLTINPKSYGQLLAIYQPKVIETEAENDRAIAFANELEHKTHRTPEEHTVLELLVTLIEKFEEEHYPIPEGSPHSILMHLMESNGISLEQLAEVMGSADIVPGIINGTHDLNIPQAKTLANFFSVDVSVFI